MANKVMIEIVVEDEYADPEDRTGITNEAYDMLTDSFGQHSLGWLGEVQDVRKVAE